MNILVTQLIQMLVGTLGRMLIQAIQKLASREVLDPVTAIAVKHVQALMSSALEGPERKAMAFKGIKEDCEMLGLKVKDWLIDTAIQAAVGDYKAKLLE